MPDQTTNSRYRIVAMIPTEIFVDAADVDDAASIMDWLFEQYPAVSYPASSESDSALNASPRVITIERFEK